jgi:hypothetical protein
VFKIKSPFLLLTGLVFMGLYINSCKKDNSGTIKTLFTGGSWQLANVTVYNYVGSNSTSYLLDTACTATQLFTFNINNTCTYTNFECITQKTTGTWSLTTNQLNLLVNMMCADTLAGNIPSTGQPFANALIMNLGQYSMVLETGDINTYYTATTKRKIIQYGFVRVSTPAGN